MTDIRLTDTSVILDGLVGIGTENPVAILHVEGEMHAGGLGGGYAFQDRQLPGQRWVWYATDGNARLFRDNVGDVFQVTQFGEAASTGSGAGFAFDGRSGGPRFVLYADGGSARLFADGSGDVLTVAADGAVATRGKNAGFGVADRVGGARWTLSASKGVLRIAADNAATQLTMAAEGEVTSEGAGAGFAFRDRAKAAQRWVWYATGGSARLFKDGKGDVVTVDSNGLTAHHIIADGAFSSRLKSGAVGGSSPLSAATARDAIAQIAPIAFANLGGPIKPGPFNPKPAGLAAAWLKADSIPVIAGGGPLGAGADLVSLIALLVRVVQDQQVRIEALEGGGKP